MRILLIEDNRDTLDYVSRGLSEQGHVCDTMMDGREGLYQASGSAYDAIIVDRMLPGLDGLSLVKSMRAANVKTPVIFLTAVDGIDDRVEGLEAGADDYLVKPFAFSELMARINALARRPAVTQDQTRLQVHDLSMNLITRRVTRGHVVIDLQPKEFTLLEVMMRNANRVVTRTMLLERVWDFRFDPKTSVVETHISRLRAKIDKPFAISLLHTVRSTGYSLRAPT